MMKLLLVNNFSVFVANQGVKTDQEVKTENIRLRKDMNEKKT